MTVGGTGLVEVIEGQSHHPNSSPGFPKFTNEVGDGNHYGLAKVAFGR